MEAIQILKNNWNVLIQFNTVPREILRDKATDVGLTRLIERNTQGETSRVMGREQLAHSVQGNKF